MRPRASRPRAGFTLAEMMIVIVLFGLVMGALFGVLVRQQRFYSGIAQVMEVRGQMRQAYGVLPAELRALSSRGGDITTFAAGEIAFRSQSGSSVLCSRPSATTVVIPPATRLFKGHVLTAWLTPPVAGEEILIYDDGPYPGNADDTWRTYTISAIATATVASGNGCPISTGFLTVLDTATSYRITTATSLSPTIVQGAPIRFGRHVRYRLYQAADGDWYVGFQSWVAGAWGPSYPVSGPHRPPSANAGESGLEFVYVDSAGNVLSTATAANRLLVARMDLTLRGATRGVVEVPGAPRGQLTDSLAASINLRNWH